jgi:hypothetical protein
MIKPKCPSCGERHWERVCPQFNERPTKAGPRKADVVKLVTRIPVNISVTGDRISVTRGRPKLDKALSGAERARRHREKMARAEPSA